MTHALDLIGKKLDLTDVDIQILVKIQILTVTI